MKSALRYWKFVYQMRAEDVHGLDDSRLLYWSQALTSDDERRLLDWLARALISGEAMSDWRRH